MLQSSGRQFAFDFKLGFPLDIVLFAVLNVGLCWSSCGLGYHDFEQGMRMGSRSLVEKCPKNYGAAQTLKQRSISRVNILVWLQEVIGIRFVPDMAGFYKIWPTSLNRADEISKPKK